MSEAEVESSFVYSSVRLLEKHLSCGEKRVDRKLPSGRCDYV